MQYKLAWKNATRSMKDYAVYFVTLVLGVCVFYMFNSIYSQQAMLGLTSKNSDSAQALQDVLSYVSVFVAIVLGFLIVYANQFFIRRRKKEMGIYLTLGMEKRSVSVILMLETMIIGAVALLVGIAAGVALSQLMSVFTGRMFDADLTRLSFIFSVSAFIKSIGFFLVVFLVVILFNVRSVQSCKLIDLIYEERKNEVMDVPEKKITIGVFAGAILMIALAYHLILKNGFLNIGTDFFLAIILGALGTLFFFFSVSTLLTGVIQTNHRLYFKNLNMFVVRQLGNRIDTNYISISVVTIVLLLTIGVFATGYGMQDVMSKELEGYAGYDFSFIGFQDEDTDRAGAPFEQLKEYLAGKPQVTDVCEVTLYVGEVSYCDFDVELASDIYLWKNDLVSFMGLSDYNKARKLQGIDVLDLGKEEYVLVTNFNSMNEFASEAVEKKRTIEVDGTVLTPKQAVIGSLENGMNQAIIVVDDSYLSSLQEQQYVLNVDCKGKEAALEFEEQLLVDQEKDMETNEYYYISKTKLLSDAMGNKALLSYLAIYLGIVFMITCAAILAIQQLTEAEDNKKRFQLLMKLGADKKMIHKALFSQILTYFLAPLLVASIHSCFGLKAMTDTMDMYGKIDIAKSSAVTALFVVGLYAVYFVVTYFGCRNVIEEKK